MKKNLLYLLIGAILSAGVISFWGYKNKAEEPVVYEYCELRGEGRFLSFKLNISVDFGLRTRQKLKDEAGKVIAFNTMVDGFNYMAGEGWEFQQAYVVTVGNRNVYHWLLKRKLKT